MTILSPGTWTRAELQNAKLRFTVAYYGGWLGGVTWTVNYTVPSVNPYYWTYSLSNVAANHTIIISDAIIEIPDEDPQYEYYPITISSINATTDPVRGTTRVVEGTDTTITIYPDDPLVTLITDNGVDVSSQLVQHGGTIPDPTIATASGASYGFTLNSPTLTVEIPTNHAYVSTTKTTAVITITTTIKKILRVFFLDIFFILQLPFLNTIYHSIIIIILFLKQINTSKKSNKKKSKSLFLGITMKYLMLY